MVSINLIIFTIIAIFLSGIFSGSEIAFLQSSKVRVEIDAAKGGVINRLIRSFSRHEDMFISTLLVGNNVVLVIYGILFSQLINPVFRNLFHGNEALMLICNTLLSTGIILIAGEFMPKSTFRINPNFMMRLLALPLFLIYIVLYPVSVLVSAISKGLMKIFGIEDNEGEHTHLTMEQLDDYLQRNLDNKDENKEVENEVKIFRNAVDFGDTTMGECMLPRNEIVAVSKENTTREQLLQRFMQTGLSKIMVFDRDIDDIIGYIHVAEMFNTSAEWQRRLKPVIFTPETMLAKKMMRRMLNEKRSVAIVVDEFGGTAGLATLEDLVEEIFGDIEDEHDRGRSLMRCVGEDSWEVSGRAEIEKINEEYGLGLREGDDYHTLGGYLISNLEALPSAGDVVTIGDFNFTILRMSDTRIELVGIVRN